MFGRSSHLVMALIFAVTNFPILTGAASPSTDTAPTASAIATPAQYQAPPAAPPPDSSAGQLQDTQDKSNDNSKIYSTIGNIATTAGMLYLMKGKECQAEASSMSAATMAKCYGLLALGVLASLAGALDNGSGKKLGNYAAGPVASNCALIGNCVNGGPNYTPPTADGGTPTDPYALPASAMHQLAAAGMSYNPKNGVVTLPDGSTIDSQAVADAAKNPNGITDPNMQAAAASFRMGADHIKSDIAAALAARSNDNGGGDGGGTLTVADGSGGRGANPFSLAGSKKNGPLGKSAKPPGSGERAMYNGEYIGLASDDIFGMINHRYDAQYKIGRFLN